MAEEIYPGTEMEIYEKYPLSWRLDHPGFADVRKTFYAKGVISDFEVVGDDPFAVNSRVKVTGDWGESDYIPLFFHPKDQYWDGWDGVKATDYNHEGGYFEKSWMSFRCEDEVNVLLLEGTPRAVLGFFDGVPRPGENIIKNPDANPIYYDNIFNLEEYAGLDAGPDGVDLGLTQQAESYSKSEYASAVPTYHCGTAWTVGPPPIGIDAYILTYDKFYNVNAELKVVLWPLKVGPFLIALFGFFEPSGSSFHEYWAGSGASYHPEVLAWQIANRSDPTIAPPALASLANSIETPWEPYLVSMCAKTGLYSEGLLSETITYLSTISPRDIYDNVNFSFGEDWLPDAPAVLKFQYNLSRFFGGYINDQRFKHTDDWFYRPHTKEELQATGLWPKEA
jgi:hypothetical protein